MLFALSWMCAGDKGCGKSMCQPCYLKAKINRKCFFCQASQAIFKPKQDLAGLLAKTHPQPDFVKKKEPLAQLVELGESFHKRDPTFLFKIPTRQDFLQKIDKDWKVLDVPDNRYMLMNRF